MPHTIRLHRVFRCPPDLLFRAFTDPVPLAKWMPPHGYAATVHSIDPRPGGSYRMSFTAFATGESHSFGGTYTQVRPGELLRYSDAFDDPNLPGKMDITITFKSVSCGTELSITQEGVPDAIPPEMCYLGWQQSLNQLAALTDPLSP